MGKSAAENDTLHARFDREFITENFLLEGGDVLPEVHIAYDTYGKLSAEGDNAVLLTHGYTSSHHMIGRSISGIAEGSWNSLVGPGKAVDTDRFFVVSSNMLGSSYGSTGPSHVDPVKGTPYGPDFPDISLVDIVTAQRALLEDLDIDHLVAVIGNSYGGFQAFQWAVTFPGFMDGVVPVTTNIKGRGDNTPELIARFEKDPHWHGGYYYDHGGIDDSMTQLRIETLINYGYREYLRLNFPDPAALDAEIERIARQWASEFDANSLITLGRASARFSVENELSRISARVLFVLSRTDKLFPPSLGSEVMAKMQKSGVEAEYFEIDSELGHTAPALDGAKWAPRLAEFISQLLTQ